MPISKEEEQKILRNCITFNFCEKLVRQYWNLVCSVVRKTFIMKQAPLIKEELEEVYQEVFFQLLDDKRRRLRQYREGEGHSLARWIVVIANHTTLNYLRKRGFDSIMWHDKKAELDEHYHSDNDTESKIIDNIAIDTALQVVSQTDRIVFKLHRFGLPSKDIADIIDSSEASVNNRISKIKKILNEFMEK